MSKDLLARPAALVLILANFIPLFGVIFLGWEASQILHLYWLENVAFGSITLLRILTNRHAWSSIKEKIFTGVFFVVHYGVFCAGHAMFVFGGMLESEGSSSVSETALTYLVENWLLLLTFFSSHFVSFVLNYHGKGEAVRLKVGEVMMLPYRRIIVLHLTIIFGGIAVVALGNSAGLVAALVIVKTVGDLILHLREHRIS